jgi:diketogulonate reductase-like aldo/keto reductase
MPDGKEFGERNKTSRDNGMEMHRFGVTGAMVPIIGQGTWYLEQAPRAAGLAALRRGLDLGLTHIDTAELYGSGKAEEIVGEAIAGRRDEVFLVSKVMPQNASRAGTIAACEKSLRRLKTDRLDCYLLHWRGRHPLAETFAAFEELKRAGKIRASGVSNFDADDLVEAATIGGAGNIACNQVLYHLGERGIEHTVIPWCEKNGVAVVGYSPFGSGNFPRASSAGGHVLARIAAAHGATPRQVALAFLTRRPTLFAIPKAADAHHVEENAAAGGLTLTLAEMAEIDAAFPAGRPRALAMI